ncbi:MAG: hypothetical protein KJP21_05435 [Bacteroidia bacterium]|nr:hypothetical protein [Bacteroidia bacterium]NNJ56175.1 hypothetical protein [Bacteroidia bacterium]
MLNKILQWVLIFALQIFVLNHLDFSTYLLPQVFIILLISLPLHVSKINQILIAFGLGLLADLFASTPGFHASACLWLILLRMWILGRIDLKEQQANHLQFNIKNISAGTFFYVTSILVLFYHLYLFSLGSIGAIDGYRLIITTMLSSALALLIIVLIQYITLRKLGE